MKDLYKQIEAAIRHSLPLRRSTGEIADAVMAVLREQEPIGELEVFTGHDRLTTFRQLPEGKYTLYLSPTPPSAPNGWQLVPIEPTPEMLYAAFAADKEYSARMFGSTDAVVSVGAYDHYVAMIAAAPKPEDTAAMPPSVPDGWEVELLDWVSACQSSYHIDSTPGHRFGGLGSNLDENRACVVEYVRGLLASTWKPEDV